MSGLYSGLSSALFGITLTNFIYYYFYEFSRGVFLRSAALKAAALNASQAKGAQGLASAPVTRQRLSTVESMLAGAVAGAMTVVCTNPIWVVNTRMTAAARDTDTDIDTDGDEEQRVGGTKNGSSNSRKKKEARGTIAALVALLKEEGLAGLFRGVLPALVLVINPILQYTLFEQMRGLLERRRALRAGVGSAGAALGGTAGVKAWEVFVMGAIGKAIATGVTYPYITVKSRMHVAKGETSTSGKGNPGAEGGKAEGMVEGLRRVVREEGVGGLYRGECDSFFWCCFFDLCINAAGLLGVNGVLY